MTNMQALIQTVDALTLEEQQQLFEYLAQQLKTPQKSTAQQPRIPDLFPGGWMSDDFDAELPDEFWGFDK